MDYAPSMASANVLVIDDEKNIRRTLKMVLESEDYQVFDAPSAEKGLELLQKHSIHCMLLDLKLPKMSGIEALQQMQAENSGELERILSKYGLSHWR